MPAFLSGGGYVDAKGVVTLALGPRPWAPGPGPWTWTWTWTWPLPSDPGPFPLTPTLSPDPNPNQVDAKAVARAASAAAAGWGRSGTGCSAPQSTASSHAAASKVAPLHGPPLECPRARAALKCRSAAPALITTVVAALSERHSAVAAPGQAAARRAFARGCLS